MLSINMNEFDWRWNAFKTALLEAMATSVWSRSKSATCPTIALAGECESPLRMLTTGVEIRVSVRANSLSRTSILGHDGNTTVGKENQ